MSTTPKHLPHVPGGRCYWCASQSHDGDHCVSARRIMGRLLRKFRRAAALHAAPPQKEGSR